MHQLQGTPSTTTSTSAQSLEGSPPSGSTSGCGRSGVDSGDLRRSQRRLAEWGASYAFNNLESTSSFGEVAQYIHRATSYEAPNLFSKWALAVGGFVTRAAQTMRLGWLLNATTGSGLEKCILDVAVFSLDFPHVAAHVADCTWSQTDCPAKIKWTIGARKNVFGIPLHANFASHEKSVSGCGVIRCRVNGTGL